MGVLLVACPPSRAIRRGILSSRLEESSGQVIPKGQSRQEGERGANLSSLSEGVAIRKALVVLCVCLVGAVVSSSAGELQVIEKGGVTLVVATVGDSVRLFKVSWWCAKSLGNKVTVAAITDGPTGCPAGSSPNPFVAEMMTAEEVAKLADSAPPQRPIPKP